MPDVRPLKPIVPDYVGRLPPFGVNKGIQPFDLEKLKVKKRTKKRTRGRAPYNLT